MGAHPHISGSACSPLSEVAVRQKAFTFVETVVGISIMTVLFLALIPTYNSWKETSRSLRCMSNLRQIGIAMNVYGQTYGYYPWAAEQTSVPNPWKLPEASNDIYRLLPFFSPYQGRTDITSVTNARAQNYIGRLFQCPTALASLKFKPSPAARQYLFNINVGTVNYWWPIHPDFPKKYPWADRPGEVFMYGDGGLNAASGSCAGANWANHTAVRPYRAATAEDLANPGLNVDLPNPNPQNFATWHALRFRHHGNKKLNLVFMDGHCESIGTNQFKLKILRTTVPADWGNSGGGGAYGPPEPFSCVGGAWKSSASGHPTTNWTTTGGGTTYRVNLDGQLY